MRRRDGEVVRRRFGDRQRGQNALLGRRRAPAVVDAVAGAHHDQQRPDVDGRELLAEEARVRRRLAEELGHGPEIRAGGDDGDLDPVVLRVSRGDRVLQRLQLRRGGRRVRDEDILRVEDVRGGIAVGARSPGQRHEEEGGAKQENRPTHAGTVSAGRGENVMYSAARRRTLE